MSRILGIGDNTVDIYVDQGMQYPGGNAVNVSVLAHRLGAATSYLGCLGRDILGDLVYHSLVAEGVDVSHCRRIEGPNAWSRITHIENDRRFSGSDAGVRSHYNLSAADESFIASHDLAHTSVHSELDEELARIKTFAPRVSYDYSEHWMRPGIERTFRYVDIAFLSAPKGSDGECLDLMRLCAEQGAGVVVITRGRQGSCAFSDGQFVFEGIRQAEVVDTLGAGDAFIAGFLVSFLLQGNAAIALAHGARNAAFACAHKGAFGHGMGIQPGQPGTDPKAT
jgi:fructoselysine 6-kinase